MTRTTTPSALSAPGVQGALERFERYLRSRRLRVTPERRAVLEAVLGRNDHFDAELLLAAMRRRRRRVSRATLYRTLEHLRAAGLVRVHRFGTGQALYESVHGRDHHDHMMCERCGRVLEFVDETIEHRQEEVCREHGFRATRHVMQIFGICAACSAEDGSPDGAGPGVV